MPAAPKHACRSPGCAALIAGGAGSYCPAHIRTERAQAKRRDRARGTAHERGYTAQWAQSARAFLAAWPLCSGVLIPTRSWTPELAQGFHAARAQDREAGRILLYLGGRVTIAARFLAEHPIYSFEEWSFGHPSAVVDHIIPHKGNPDLFWAEWNWQPLAKRAHDRKTAREDRGGWPVSPSADHRPLFIL